MVIIFGLDNGDRDVGLVLEDAISPFRFAPTYKLASNDDAALREADFLADLGHFIPPCLLYSGDNELGADMAFPELLFVHAAILFPNAESFSRRT